MPKRKGPPVQLEEASTGGRARVKLDENLLKALAAIGCSQEEIAAGLRAGGCQLDLRTLKRRLTEEPFRAIYEQGLNEFRLGIRRQQKRQSMLMNSAGVQMSIHLSKHFLGQTEKSALELTGKDGGAIETKDVSARQLIESRIAGIASRTEAKRDPEEPK